jgi:hypothetical protein
MRDALSGLAQGWVIDPWQTCARPSCTNQSLTSWAQPSQVPCWHGRCSSLELAVKGGPLERQAHVALFL